MRQNSCSLFENFVKNSGKNGRMRELKTLHNLLITKSSIDWNSDYHQLYSRMPLIHHIAFSFQVSDSAEPGSDDYNIQPHSVIRLFKEYKK